MPAGRPRSIAPRVAPWLALTGLVLLALAAEERTRWLLVRSLALAPDRLVEDWPAAATAAALEPAHLQPLLELQPELIVLGTGARQAFPPPAVMAACLTRGIGIEVMDNAAAARTYNVLAGEGRRVVVALLLDGGAGD